MTTDVFAGTVVAGHQTTSHCGYYGWVTSQTCWNWVIPPLRCKVSVMVYPFRPKWNSSNSF